MKQFLEIYNLPRLNWEERDSQNRPVTRSEIEFVTILIKVIIKTPSNSTPQGVSTCADQEGMEQAATAYL